MTATGAEVAVAQLEQLGVETVFGIPGARTLAIHDALTDSHIEHITTRHEQGAGFMADGYTRVTGNPSVVLTTGGPGLTNALTAIAQANSNSSPILVVSTAPPTNSSREGGQLHELKDSRTMMDGVVPETRRACTVADIPNAIVSAFESFETDRPRPVHLEIPVDITKRSTPVKPVEMGIAEKPMADPARVEEAVDLLAAADRPLLVVGGGASGATDRIRRFVDRVGLPTVTTVSGKGIVPGTHDLYAGTGLVHEALIAFAETRDLVLAVGTELNPRDVRIDTLSLLVQIDIDSRVIGQNYPAEVGIVSDTSEAVERIAALATDRGISFGNRTRQEVRELRSELAATTDEGDRWGLILDVLRKSLADDAIVCNDMTKLSYEARGRFPVETPDTFLFPQRYGTLGFGPPAAYGAAFSAPNRQVVALVGDGGVLFTIQELATAVRLGLGVPVIVMNNASYSTTADKQRRRYGRTVGTALENPNFVDLAESFGASACRLEISTIDETLPLTLETAFDRDRPTVIEIPVTSD